MKSTEHEHTILGAEWWSLAELQRFFAYPTQGLRLSAEVWDRVERNAAFLQQKIGSDEGLHYGVNTGFGSLCNVRIEREDLQDLQHNLLMSHACGMGAEVDAEIVRLMLLLKIKNLSLGHSAVRRDLLERLCDFYREGVLPVVYELGSLGASGDLAPLAHLSLPLIGLGEVNYRGERMPTAKALDLLGWQPLKLAMKEGLALLNGTQFCLAHGIYAYWQAQRLNEQADMTAALSMDAFDCRLSPFDARLHKVRPHAGQIETAAAILRWLEGSEQAAQPKTSVQDPYSFRCVPQVHGASRDALRYVGQVFETELNSVTDNPTVFDDSDAILSGGNFHAQPLALALDFAAIAVAELGSISERRLYQLISGQRGLPPMLTAHSGLHSGLMITQYAAAAIVSQNKQLCTPASVDSIVSCNGQEDHVSMGANAATKFLRVVRNAEQLLAIEFLAAAQAMSFRAFRSSPALQSIVEAFRQTVPVLEGDRVMYSDIAEAARFLRHL